MSKRKSKVQEPIQQIGAWEHALPYLDGPTMWWAVRKAASMTPPVAPKMMPAPVPMPNGSSKALLEDEFKGIEPNV